MITKDERIDFLEKLLCASHGPKWTDMSIFCCSQKALEFEQLEELTKERDKFQKRIEELELKIIDNENRDKLLIKVAKLEERVENLILEATDRWHKSESKKCLNDWLGISVEEYKKYVEGK